MASPEPTVTIHRGELAQIKKLITKSKQQKPARGQFYGLWTHSFQPVIQVVVGLPGSKADKKDSEEYFSKCEKIITKSHGLRLLGEWLGAVPNRGSDELEPPVGKEIRYVNMSFKMEGDKIDPAGCVVKRSGHLEKQKGKLEILPGQSSFRLYENLTKELKHSECDGKPLDVKGEDEAAAIEAESGQVREAEVKEDQWYSTEDGMEILRFLFQYLNNFFQVLETSRNTDTHNIGFSLLYTASKSKLQKVTIKARLEFPADFPKSAATLIRDGKETRVQISKELIKKSEELAQVTCTTVLSLLEPQPDKPKTTPDADAEDTEMREPVTQEGGPQKEHQMADKQEIENKGTKQPSGLPPVEDVEATQVRSAQPTGDTPESPAGSGSNKTEENPAESGSSTTEVNPAKSGNNTGEISTGSGSSTTEVNPAKSGSNTGEISAGSGSSTTKGNPAESGSNTGETSVESGSSVTEGNPAGSGGNTGENPVGCGSTTTTEEPMEVDTPVDTQM